MKKKKTRKTFDILKKKKENRIIKNETDLEKGRCFAYVFSFHTISKLNSPQELPFQNPSEDFFFDQNENTNQNWPLLNQVHSPNQSKKRKLKGEQMEKESIIEEIDGNGIDYNKIEKKEFKDWEEKEFLNILGGKNLILINDVTRKYCNNWVNTKKRRLSEISLSERDWLSNTLDLLSNKFDYNFNSFWKRISLLESQRLKKKIPLVEKFPKNLKEFKNHPVFCLNNQNSLGNFFSSFLLQFNSFSNKRKV